MVPLEEGKMDLLHCDNCGGNKKFSPKRIPVGVMSAPEQEKQ